MREREISKGLKPAKKTSKNKRPRTSEEQEEEKLSKKEERSHYEFGNRKEEKKEEVVVAPKEPEIEYQEEDTGIRSVKRIKKDKDKTSFSKKSKAEKLKLLEKLHPF
mmetsp:Transcript_12067/g.10666  ORF Transcript_12067/g.10666 Transcript_12067/m.10666 type:complete len:107 (+) Transcript_12067:55-375(+)